MILFSADWCKYCKVVKKFLDENPDIQVDIVDVDQDMELPAKHGVKQLPALLKADGDLMVESQDIIEYLKTEQ